MSEEQPQENGGEQPQEQPQDEAPQQEAPQEEHIEVQQEEPQPAQNNMVDEKQVVITNEMQDPIQQKAEHYNAKLSDLILLVKKTQERDVCEEIDFLNTLGGESYVTEGLKTSVDQGIQLNEMDSRKEQYGTNIFAARDPKTFCELVIEALDDLTMQILIVCAIISIILNGIFEYKTHPLKFWNEGLAILIAVAACTLVGAGNDYQKEKQFAELQKVAEDKKLITVIRGGEELPIHSSLVLVGDVVKIEEGMNIPCDGFVIKAIEVRTDESAMTGETDPIKKGTMKQCQGAKDASNRIDYEGSLGQKKVPSPVLLSGTKILNGEGRFVCIVVGEDSCAGKIRAQLSEEDEVQTPLQEKLEVIATDISLFGLVGASFTVVALLIAYIIRSVFQAVDGNYDAATLRYLLDYFIVGIAIIVMAVPEGLPLAVTLALAFSVKKMLADNNLVRQLQACETMGGANCICSDKTGTLTQNKMSLVEIWNKKGHGFNEFEEHDLSGDPFNIKNNSTVNLLKCSFVCNASAHGRRKIKDPSSKTGFKELEPSGNKTEIALVNFMDRAGVDYAALREEYHPSANDNLVRYPFSSSRKRMTTEVLDCGDGKGNVLLLKGASEIVLGCCSKIHYWEGDQVTDLSQGIKDEIHKSILGMAKKTLRTLCFGYKHVQNVDKNAQPDQHGVYEVEKSGFTLFAVTGIKDTLRPTVKASVLTCQKAGIKVRMVTGDNRDTAEAIAIECGLITNHNDPGYDSNKHVWIGKVFWEHVGGLVDQPVKGKDGKPKKDKKGKAITVKKLGNQDAFNEVYKDLCVMARSRPEDKLAMVIGLIELNKVVAVTGDGTNDAPALKRADVGFAMGIAGTEVAREASDIILVDDNFTSIVQAVLWGRNIYDSVRKFLQFQLTINVVAVFCVFIAALETQNSILTAVQMLWVNMIMDTFAALALATEAPEQKLLDRPPHNRNDYIVSKTMFKHIIVHTFWQSFIILLFTFWSEKFIPEPLKDNDPSVAEMNINVQDIWDKYDDKESNNKFDSYEDFVKNIAIYCRPENEYIISGKAFRSFGQFYDYYPISYIVGPSRQLTLVFNVFVFLQIFNFVNARKIQDEINVFENIHKSYWFIGIIILIVVMQILFVQLGGSFVDCNLKGLAMIHWIWSVVMGSTGLIVAVLTKIISKAIEKSKGEEEEKPTEYSQVSPENPEQ